VVQDYSTSRGYDKATTTTAHIYASSNLDPSLDPRKIEMRESCDSDLFPNSTPIIVAFDVTGSMDPVLDAMARQGLNALCSGIYERKPVSDPHILCMGIGDAEYPDKAPLQVTQFETDMKIVDQLTKIWLEKGGGGNNHESHLLPWYFAAFHTKCDSWLKRKKKGYLFTIGDEEPMQSLPKSIIKDFLGKDCPQDFTADTLLNKVSQTWEVFHLMVKQGSYMSKYPDRVTAGWVKLLGQRALVLSDFHKLGEVILSAIQVCEGSHPEEVAASWDGTTGLVVREAVSGLISGRKEQSSGVVRL
jgi:hypothetical protein